jgi:hypothetical protein
VPPGSTALSEKIQPKVGDAQLCSVYHSALSHFDEMSTVHFLFDLFFAMNFSNQRRLCDLVFGMRQAESTGGADFAATKYVQQVARAVAVVLPLFTSILFF